MKRLILLFSLFQIAIAVLSQTMKFQHLFEKSFVIVNEKKGNEKFKGQILKGKRNGMGFILYKKGAFFAGDFYRNEISGYGLLINHDKIDNCSGCKIYVGNWKDGKKSGFGTCYSDDGKIIYRGQFIDDKPIGEYPSENTDTIKRLALISLDDGSYFLGEIKENKPHGFGIIIFANGDLWQSSFKSGERKGIGLHVTNDGEWETINVKGDNYDVVSSSERYRSMESVRKENFRNAFSTAMGYFEKAAQTGVELVKEINQSENGSNEVNVSDNSIIVAEDNNKTNRSTAGNTKCNECLGNGKCSGSGSSSRYHCHGSGKCYACHGKSNKGVGRHETAGQYGDCDVCNNTGKCKYCNGTGKCLKCNGTGRI